MDLIFTLSLGFFLGMFLLLIGTSLITGAAVLRGRRKLSPFTPPISIIIPAYKEEARIERCIRAVQSAGYPEIEIIVIDDGSPDKTTDIAARTGARVIRQNHLGKVAALNRGIAEAKHDFIVTIDGDTFVRPGSIQELLRPLQDAHVGAVSGIANVYNKKNLLGMFQAVEYPYISFLREVFSRTFLVTPGICGAFTCFRKTALQKVGGFKSNTVLEDFDIAVHLIKHGYGVETAPKAISETVVPVTVRGLFRQRMRWLKGSMQCVLAHKDVFLQHKIAMTYILVGQVFWFVYSFFALPLMLYHLFYWLPSNAHTLLALSWYLFRWVSLAGVAYLLYKIPEWGINWTYIFGILAGAISSTYYVIAIRRYDSFGLRHLFAIFFFFPYTLLMSLFMMSGVVDFFRTRGKGTFIS